MARQLQQPALPEADDTLNTLVKLLMTKEVRRAGTNEDGESDEDGMGSGGRSKVIETLMASTSR